MTDLKEKAREFYRKRSSSYTPKMDGSDRYNLMADFAAQCVAEAVKEDRAKIIKGVVKIRDEREHPSVVWEAAFTAACTAIIDRLLEANGEDV